MEIKIIIDRFEGDKAVLKTIDHQTIIWPKNKLPNDAKESGVLFFNIQIDKDKEEQSKKLAKTILNEILNTENNDDKK